MKAKLLYLGGVTSLFKVRIQLINFKVSNILFPYCVNLENIQSAYTNV